MRLGSAFAARRDLTRSGPPPYLRARAQVECSEHFFQTRGVLRALIPVSIHVHIAHEHHRAVRVVGVCPQMQGEVGHHQSLWVCCLVSRRVGHRVARLPPCSGNPACVLFRPTPQLVCIRCAAGARIVGADRYVGLDNQEGAFALPGVEASDIPSPLSRVAQSGRHSLLRRAHRQERRSPSPAVSVCFGRSSRVPVVRLDGRLRRAVSRALVFVT